VLLYGEPRLTRDIDVTLGINVDRLKAVLSLKALPEDTESFVRQTMVLPSVDETTGIRVDFIFSFSPYEAVAIKRARKIRIMGVEVCFASLEDLVIHKIFSGRPRDLEDVRVILLKNPGIDAQYVRNWLREFDRAMDQKDFLETFEKIFEETRD